MTIMDISRTAEPDSSQLNFDDVASHPATITITEVTKGPPDQPVHIHSAEYPGRPYKPGKSMRRVLIAAWGSEASAYVGRRITLYGDPTIRFGKETLGGIRIRALSDIDAPKTINLTVTRGKRSPFTVEPIDPPKDTSGRDWLTELADAKNEGADAIRALGVAAVNAHANPAVVKVIRQAYTDAKQPGGAA